MPQLDPPGELYYGAPDASARSERVPILPLPELPPLGDPDEAEMPTQGRIVPPDPDYCPPSPALCADATHGTCMHCGRVVRRRGRQLYRHRAWKEVNT